MMLPNSHALSRSPFFLIALLPFALTLACHAPDSKLQVTLKFTRATDLPPAAASFTATTKIFTLTRGNPPKNTKLPRLINARPRTCRLQFGDEPRLLVFDQRDSSDTLFRRLYFDANGNGDLTDDKPFDGELEEQNPTARAVRYPPFDMIINKEGKDRPYSFTLRLELRGPADIPAKPPQASLVVAANGCYVGEFDCAGRHWHLLLADHNLNGRFDDFCKAPESDADAFPEREIPITGDALYLSAGQPPGPDDQLNLHNRLLLGGKLYEFGLHVADGKLILKEIHKRLIPVELGAETTRLQLRSEEGVHYVNALEPGRQIKLPPSRWQVLDYEMLRKDERGDIWRLQAAATQSTPFVEVGARQSAKLDFGEPYLALASFSAWESNWLASKETIAEAGLDFSLKGQAHERVFNLVRMVDSAHNPKLAADGGRPQEPTYTISDNAGAAVASGTFAYTEKMAGHATWSGAQKGAEYQVQCNYQAGPYKTVCEKKTIKFQ